MLSDERIMAMAPKSCRVYMEFDKGGHHECIEFDEPGLIAFARAIEREATAEATRIMRELIAADDALLADLPLGEDDVVSEVMRRTAEYDRANKAIRNFVERME